MESAWLTYAKRLQAIASTGLHFARDEHDRERYEDVARIANEMLSRLGDTPVSRIRKLVSDFAQGYATPRVDVRAAVIRDDRILLVRESTDGLWSLPGGYADFGLSPRENVVKEVYEEANIRVELPALSTSRVLRRDIEDAFARAGPTHAEVLFD